MGNCECGRLKGNPCGPLRLNTINVTMPMHYPSILALVLKVLAPLLSYYAVYRSERKKQQDKSMWEAAKRTGVPAAGAVLFAAGLVVDHMIQTASVEAAREQVTEEQQARKWALEDAARSRQERQRIEKLTAEAVAILRERNPGLTEEEALDLLAEELRELYERTAGLEDQLTGLRLYSDVSTRDVLGYPDPYKAKSVISYSDDLTRALEDTWVERGDQYHPRCDQPTLDKFLAVTVSHPSFPFTYYALSVCAFKAGKDTWHQYTDRALGILERTTQFEPPHRQHVQAYERLRARLEQQ